MLKKLFGEVEMTWKKIIIFAIIAGVYTGVVAIVPFGYDSSLKDISVCFEWWVLFGTIIAVNCQTPLEAGKKIFIFFLISQPLVYLVETPFRGFHVWSFYRYWFIWTLLTFPGGMIANLVRKKNLLSALILSVATGLLAGEMMNHLVETYFNFPKHLVTVIICALAIILFLVYLLDQGKYRVLVAVITLVAFLGMGYVRCTTESSSSIGIPEGQWECSLDNTTGCRLEVDEEECRVYYKAYANPNTLTLTNKQGEKIVYTITFSPNHNMNIIPK